MKHIDDIKEGMVLKVALAPASTYIVVSDDLVDYNGDTHVNKKLASRLYMRGILEILKEENKDVVVLSELVKMAEDATYGDNVYRLMIFEKSQIILNKLQNQ